MTWQHIAENKRCQGRPIDDEGRRGRRCRTVLFVGARFWLDGVDGRGKVAALCPDCAINPDVPKVICPPSSTPAHSG